MTWRAETSQLISGKWVAGNRGLGLTGTEILAATSTGDDGPGLMSNDITSGDLDSEFRVEITVPPVDGSLWVYEDGSFTYTPINSLTKSFTYRLWKDGISLGLATAYINYGAIPPVIPVVSGTRRLLLIETLRGVT